MSQQILQVCISCSCGERITYEAPSFSVTCQKCGEVWAAVPEMRNASGWTAKFESFEKKPRAVGETT